MKNTFHERVGSKPVLVFYKSHEFGIVNGMLYPCTDYRNLPVEFFLLIRKYLAFGFLDKLYDSNFFWSISLISCVLVQCTRNGGRITYLLAACFPKNGWADKESHVRYGDDNSVLYHMMFLFSSVLFIVNRRKNLPFCLVMKQYRLGLFWESSGKYSEDSLSVCAGISPIVSRVRRRIWGKQYSNVLQCFWYIPKQTAWAFAKSCSSNQQGWRKLVLGRLANGCSCICKNGGGGWEARHSFCIQIINLHQLYWFE